MILLVLASLQPAPPPVVVPSGSVQVPDRNYRSHGEFTCRLWSDARAGRGRGDPELLVSATRAWLRAYFTAFNLYGPGNGNIVGAAPFTQVDGALDDYCARNGARTVGDAMPGLIVALARRSAAAPAQPSAPGTKRIEFHFTTRCSQWNAGKTNSITRLALTAAAGGFLTAYNLWGPDAGGDVVGSFELDGVAASLDTYCADDRKWMATGLMHFVQDAKPTSPPH